MADSEVEGDNCLLNHSIKKLKEFTSNNNNNNNNNINNN